MDSPLHFEETGSGPPLVFVAGLGGEGRFWSRQLAFFARTHRVISYDHGGCGRSAGAPANRSVESMSEDLAHLLAKLGVADAVVVGHSTGGAIAQVLAAEQPGLVSRLVLSSTWLRADRYMRELFELRLAVMKAMGPTRYAALGRILCYGPLQPTDEPTLRVEPGVDPASAGTAVAASTLANPVTLATLSTRIDALLAFDGSLYAPRVRQPVLIAGARDDMITPSYLWDELEAAYRQATRRQLDHGGHFCPQTMTDAYNATLEEFILR